MRFADRSNSKGNTVMSAVTIFACSNARFAGTASPLRRAHFFPSDSLQHRPAVSGGFESTAYVKL
jgi:hypothetical protein